MSAHASLPPPGVKRWTACPGSVAAECEALKQAISSFVETGTHGQALFARCLLERLPATAVCSGASYDDSEQWQRLHDRRLDMLEEIHSGHDRPTFVFMNYRHELERIQQRFLAARELTAYRTDVWNFDDIDMLVAHPAASGHGVNLQHSSDTIVWFSLPRSAELFAQANARIAHQGHRNTVNVHIMLSRGRIDEIAYRVVHQRLVDQDRPIRALA